MKSLFILICIISCIASFSQAKTSTKKVVCYYGTWSVWRPGHGRFQVNDIDPTICTHIIYTFFGLSPDAEIRYLDPYLDLPDNYGKDNIRRFIGLKSINPDVKLIAAIGGWNEGSVTFSRVASTEGLRTRFAFNIVNFLNKWGFDGIDIDWEYPAQRGGNPLDKENFVLMLQAIKHFVHPLGKSLSIAAGATQISASISYDIANVAANVDFINLMTYDMHGSWENVTGIHSALYAYPGDETFEQRILNGDSAVHFWLSEGCPREKLIFGIPTYGRTFTLANSENYRIGDRIIAPGFIGAFVPEPGFLAYNEICYTRNEWTQHWESYQEVPYAVNFNQWVGYDDLKSVERKLLYILAMDLGGAIFWSVDTDDFSNLCGDGKYPLISLAWGYMSGEIEPHADELTTRQPTTLPPPSEITTRRPGDFICPELKGLFRDPADDSKFYLCADGIAHHFDISVLFRN